MVLLDEGGRLGNKIWAYAALWSLARLMGRAAYVPDSNLIPLKKVFANLSLHSLQEIKHCKLDLGAPLSHTNLLPLESIKQKFNGKNMLLRSWTFFPKLIMKYFNETKVELAFRPEILRDVEATVERVGGKNRTRVGIHVRRTDFIFPQTVHSPLVGKSYFQVR